VKDWARNLEDGSVEFIAAAGEFRLKKFVRALDVKTETPSFMNILNRLIG